MSTISHPGYRSAQRRADALGAELREREVDVLLVNAPFNVRYLTGYTGSSGAALLGVDADAPRRFFTDFRYVSQSELEVPPLFEREIVAGDLLEAAAASLEGSGAKGGGRLGFDDAHLSVQQHTKLALGLPAGWDLVACGGLVEGLREIKDEDEVGRIRAAAGLVDEVLEWIAERGLVGRTERQVAIDLEHEMRLRGARAPSFSSIVAAAEHGALPHAQPRDVPIPKGCLVTIDLGALMEGYCSDCTRTFATGELEGEAREVYETVLAAQEAGVAAVKAGPNGREVDGVARAVIEQAGYGEYFGHGLGHGVGLEIHEAPRLSRTAGDAPLRAGHVVTVEPGIYLPGRFGVRIEDLLVVTDDGSETLSLYSKQLITVD
jgi:Xaa-Pro aminopeptidase